ncbi:MAG: class I SAM-dependent methyltransferase [Acidobacteria bacterium]|nr:class I SAM-dependent methyltransferase [Acidobacteriota bacterium]
MSAFSSINFTADRLHLGCGLNAPADWLNVDGSAQVWFARHPAIKRLLLAARIYPASQAAIPWPANVLRLDLRKPLPFADNRFVAVYSSHTFEHLYRAQAEQLARECFRVLKPGGVCRLVLPDLEAAVRRYLARLNGEAAGGAGDQLMEELLVHPTNPPRGFHQHKWMYDAAGLRRMFSETGFAEVTNRACCQGRLPGVAQIENPSRVTDGAGVVVEGVKPCSVGQTC